MDLKECRFDTWDEGQLRTGMRPVTIANGVKATHLPTGLTATARTSQSQHRNRNVTLAMLDAGITGASRQVRAGSGGLRVMDIIEELAILKGDFGDLNEQDVIRSLICEAKKYVPKKSKKKQTEQSSKKGGAE